MGKLYDVSCSLIYPVLVSRFSGAPYRKCIRDFYKWQIHFNAFFESYLCLWAVGLIIADSCSLKLKYKYLSNLVSSMKYISIEKKFCFNWRPESKIKIKKLELFWSVNLITALVYIRENIQKHQSNVRELHADQR